MTIQVQKGSAFLGGGWTLSPLYALRLTASSGTLGLFLEEAEEEEGEFQLWLFTLALIPAVGLPGFHSAFLTFSWVSGSALILL